MQHFICFLKFFFIFPYLSFLTRNKAIVLKYVHNGTFSLHGGQTLSYTVSGAVTKRKIGVGMTGSFVLWRKSSNEILELFIISILKKKNTRLILQKMDFQIHI
jgi:hypothetical protein